MTATGVDLADIQGLLRYGYGHHTESVFLALRVRDRAAARAWLARAEVANAVPQSPLPATVLQVALSAEGLAALGVADDITAAFSPEFVAGMADPPERSRRLGDTGANDPAGWPWGTGGRTAHVLLLLYALPGGLDAFEQAIQAQCAAAFDLVARLPTIDMGGVEPFGFTDGISQPAVDWTQTRRMGEDKVLRYGNDVCLGEFVLGYRNEYGLYTDRPLLDPQRDPQALLARAEDQPDMADLGRNGSYLVLRQLEQDVAGFWRWIDAATQGDATERELLAAAMVGRTKSGEPLAGCGDRGLNAFDFDADPDGLRCPLGAHVRRANPRTADMPAGTGGRVSQLVRTLGFDATARRHDLVAPARLHRLLRRGREYRLAAEDRQGLHFVALNANIARQFEFVQAAWIASAHFNGLSGEVDPLLGTRSTSAGCADAFSHPSDDCPNRRESGLPQFVTLRGGGYFFLPGLRALRYLMEGSR
jgi:Dyp-type peroxidase family